MQAARWVPRGAARPVDPSRPALRLYKGLMLFGTNLGFAYENLAGAGASFPSAFFKASLLSQETLSPVSKHTSGRCLDAPVNSQHPGAKLRQSSSLGRL